ncbi:MAG: rod shape-determining protein RodA [Ruminococcaceae bacterium]|nr:rod shape-determining protein RodA [Oscillospiraceae bacterium]
MAINKHTNIDKQNILKNFDFVLLFLTVLTSIFGMVMIMSATASPFKYLLVQGVALILGITAVFFLMIVDYEYLAKMHKYLYAVSVFLLVLVLIPGIGTVENGARSWFRIGNLISIQPAEFAKLFFIITFSKHISGTGILLNRPKNVLLLCVHIIVLVGLVLLQPDFGTAMVFLCMAFVMLFAAGLAWKYIVALLGVATVAVPVSWFFVLQPYQKDRILTLFNPEADPMGSGYHVVHSKITVGSGQFFGTGLFEGASQYNNFLPERHTDFIFSVVCEELGFIGAVAVIALLVAIILRCVYIGINARNDLGKYICLGVASMFAFHLIENVGMCIGVMPVTGIPLPFFSYGGSSLLTNLVAIGMVMNVKYRSKVINF